jgi:hypothetical protein
MAKSKAKGTGRKAPRRGGAAHVADAPLGSLTRDQLSVFLYVSLTPEETRALVKERGLSVPGFRTASLGDVERCDVIADDVRADPAAAKGVLAVLEKAFERPPLAATALGPDEADDLLDVGGGDAALALTLWRVLSDRDPEVRARALPLLDDLARHYFGPVEGGGRGAEATTPAEGDPARDAEALAAQLARAERQLAEAQAVGEQRAEEARRKAEEQRERLQATLREARAAESLAQGELARAREDAAAARAERARLAEELDALRSLDLAVETQRARAEARDLAGRVGALEARLERSREREEALGRELAAASKDRPAAAQLAAHAATTEAVGDAEAGELETWLFPVYTREFYDSLEGWDRRIQRAAFKQANLLAQDHRHPSLRAIPLEGLPGYYRVRVATDVRLIYRRPERQNAVEILSLIDREDLDRYIRQAKTRA